MTKSHSLGWTMFVAFVIALGIGSAWETIVRWAENSVYQATRNRGSSESISVARGGEPLLVRSSYLPTGFNYRYGTRSTTDEVVTLDGQPRSVNPGELYGGYGSFQGSDRYNPEPPASWWERLGGVNDGGVPEVYWYLVHDGNAPGRVYGVGYHSKTSLIVSYFAPKGFSPAKPPPEDWFQIVGPRLRNMTTLNINASVPYYSSGEKVFPLLANGKLWLIDLPRRQIKGLVDCPTGYEVGSIYEVPEQATAAEERQGDEFVTAVRQEDSFVVADKRTGATTKYALPVKLKEAWVTPWVLPDKKLLVHASWWQPPKPPRAELLWIDTEGQVVKEQQIRSTDEIGVEFPIPEVWMENLREPIPLAKAMLWVTWTQFEAKEAKSFWVGLGKVFGRSWLSTITLIAIGVAFAWATYRRQKRFGLPHPGAWAAFVFLLGIPGWIAFRFHRLWPVLEECPHCHQITPRDRTACLDCGTPIPPPPLKGIEVFA